MNLLDLRSIPCPLNSSKALIYLLTIDSGEVVTFYIDDGEPIDNVPSSLENEGHVIIKTEKVDDNYWVLTVKAV
jgi:sulfite reductase (ferredoxin)